VAVTFDQHSRFNNGAGSVATLTHSFTIGSVTNGAAVASLIVGTAALSAITASWNGVSMTQITGTLNNSGGINSGCLVLFGVTATQMGGSAFTGTHNLVFSWTGSGPATIALASFGNCDQTGGATTFINGTTSDNANSSASSTKAVTTASGNATVGVWDGGSTFSGTQTPAVDWQENVGGVGQLSEGQHILSTGASDSFTATMSATDQLDGTFCAILAGAVTAAGFQRDPGVILRPNLGAARGLAAVRAFPPAVVPGDTFANTMRLLDM
jgi:hypothetical protein